MLKMTYMFTSLSCQRHSSHPPQRWFKIDKDKTLLLIIDYSKWTNTNTKTLTLIIDDGRGNNDIDDNNKILTVAFAIL